jgi:hypothetical protein
MFYTHQQRPGIVTALNEEDGETESGRKQWTDSETTSQIKGRDSIASRLGALGSAKQWDPQKQNERNKPKRERTLE